MPKAIVYPLFGKIKVEYLFDEMTLGMPSIRMLNIEKRKHKNFQEVSFLKKRIYTSGFFDLQFSWSILISFIKTFHVVYHIW